MPVGNAIWKRKTGLVIPPPVTYYEYYQWVFSEAPVLVSGSYYFQDKTSNTVGWKIVSGTVPTTSYFAAGDTVLNAPTGDLGLFRISQQYSLGWYGADENHPLPITYDDLVAYNQALIPDADFMMIVDAGKILHMVTQPYELLYDVDDEVIFGGNNQPIEVLKY